MKATTAPYVEGLKKNLAETPEEAAAYLNAALEEGSQEIFLLALRDVAEACGFAKLAREADLNRENMYRILSETGNPRISSLASILDSLGLKLAVEPKATAA